MARKSKTSHLAVYVEVLQNGSTLASCQVPLRKNKTLALTDDRDSILSIPHFPLPNGRLEFLNIHDGRATLQVEYNWEGFCTSGGRLINMDRAEKGRRTIDLEASDYGSISRDDLRILFKVARPKKAAPKPKKLPRAYQETIWKGFLRGKSETTAAFSAILFLLIAFGGVAAGFYMRDYKKPKKIDHLADEYILPFTAGSHLLHAPEAQQNQLNRKDLLRSTISFYRTFTSILMGWNGSDAKHLFPATTTLYRQLFEELNKRIENGIKQQASINHRQRERNQGVLSIPAVVGESQSGSMLRVIDKIDIAQQAFAMAIAERRQLTGIFKKETEEGSYNYENYKDSSQKPRLDAKRLSQIRTWAPQTDEELMYTIARKMADQAQKARERITAPGSFGEPLTPVNAVPLILPAGVSFASFLDDVDFMSADARIDEVQGDSFGQKPREKTAPPEQLSGVIDKNLIQRYIENHRYQLKLCYDIALRRDNSAQGTMEWSFRIDPRGRIYEIALISSSIKDEKMAQCVRQKLSKWTFPRPRNGSVEIRYPFSFAPAKG